MWPSPNMPDSMALNASASWRIWSAAVMPRNENRSVPQEIARPAKLACTSCPIVPDQLGPRDDQRGNTGTSGNDLLAGQRDSHSLHRHPRRSLLRGQHIARDTDRRRTYRRSPRRLYQVAKHHLEPASCYSVHRQLTFEQLRVAATYSSRGLGTSSGDLDTEIGGGDQDLGDRDTVIRDKGHSEQVSDIRIDIDNLADIDDKSNDKFGDIVSGGGFARKDIRPRLHVLPLFWRSLLDSKISVNDREHVKSLSLVLVQSLDLTGKDRIEIDGNTKFRFEDFGKSALVVLLDGSEGLSEFRVVSHWQEVGQQLRVEKPLVAAEGMGDEPSELWVTLEDPSDHDQLTYAATNFT